MTFAAAAGQFLICANGVDEVMHWNGSSWVTWSTAVTPSAPGEISGVSPDQLDQVISHQRRLWFVQPSTSLAWYSPVNSVGGALVSFDFGPLFPRGGTLFALGSWTVNNANGPQNRLVAISSVGDAVIYEGTDPADSTKWSLVGTWRLPAPVGKRCFKNKAGDLLYNCSAGVVPLTQFLQTTDLTSAISDNIRDAIASVALTNGSLDGWQIHDYLAKNIIIVNVPQIDPNSNFQFVLNTNTGGWSVFTGWPAQCWESIGNETYFGAYEKVMWAFQGYKDNALYDGTGGDVYSSLVATAFNYFENRA
ncbi:hypothetical protein, partial [Pseudomonas sp.]|uniref:hypothetical protein n=1 Tax=Pseudomonas sp. TaxID=306 RepID=UPI0040539142